MHVVTKFVSLSLELKYAAMKTPLNALLKSPSVQSSVLNFTLTRVESEGNDVEDEDGRLEMRWGGQGFTTPGMTRGRDSRSLMRAKLIIICHQPPLGYQMSTISFHGFTN